MTTEVVDLSAEAPPALYTHCCTIYAIMERESSVRKINDQDVCLWEGALTNLVLKQANLSLPVYSSVTARLKSMGCIHQMRRGGGTSKSVWQLIKEPTYEDYVSCTDAQSNQPVTRGSLAQVEQAQRDMNATLQDHERKIDLLISILKKSGIGEVAR